MGLYQSKLFLTFDDVIDYLADKGVYHAKASSSLDTKKIKKALFEYVLTGLLTPVFYYDGLVKESFEIDSKSLLIKGWICANEKMIKELFFDNDLGTNRINLNIQEYLKIYALHKENIFSNGGIISEVFDGYVFMDTRRYKIELPILDLDFDEKPIEPKNRTEILFDILEEMDRDRKNNPELEITLDDYKDKLPKTLKNDIWLTFDDLEYPKSQLDEIFDPSQSNNRQQQIADLQAENARLQAENADLLKRIAELESQLNQARENGTPAFMNHTEEIAIIGAVYDEFWANLAPNEIPPKKDTVLDWIAKNYKISNNIASAIDTICRPPEPRKGGQKSR